MTVVGILINALAIYRHENLSNLLSSFIAILFLALCHLKVGVTTLLYGTYVLFGFSLSVPPTVFQHAHKVQIVLVFSGLTNNSYLTYHSSMVLRTSYIISDTTPLSFPHTKLMKSWAYVCVYSPSLSKIFQEFV